MAVAVALRLGLIPALGSTAPFITFLPAVLIAAVLGGYVGGIVASAATIAIVIAIASPSRLATQEFVALAIYAAECVLVVAVTETLRRVRSSLHASQERLVTALNASGVGTWRWDLATNAVEWDESARRVYGVAAEQAPHTVAEFLALVHPDDREHTDSIIRTRLQGEADGNVEFRIIAPDGSVRWIHDRSSLVRDRDGRPIYLIGACLDVTARKRGDEERQALAQALAEQRVRLETIVRHMPVGVIVGDGPSGAIVLGNEEAERIIGRKLTARSISRYDQLALHPDGRIYAADEWPLARALLNGEEVKEEEIEVVRIDGEHRLLSVSASPIRDQEDRAVAAVVTFSDVTERKAGERREKFLAQFNESLRHLNVVADILETAARSVADFFEAAVVGYGEIDADCRYAEINVECRRAGPSLLGRHELDPLGASTVGALRSGRTVRINDVRTNLEFASSREAAARFETVASLSVPILREDRWVAAFFINAQEPRNWTDQDQAVAEQIAERTWVAVERVRAEEELRRINATLETRVEARTTELMTANRELLTQIAEREKAEAALRQAQRLEAIGQLTAGLAHDFNNLLMVFSGNLEFLAKTAEQGSATARRITMMQAAAQRGSALTRQLLAFARKQALSPRPTDIGSIVSNMQPLLQSTLGGSIEIRTQSDADLSAAMVDPGQIELVILNLAINSRDAMPAGGRLAIETCNVEVGAPERPENPSPGSYVVIRVSDTGAGMTPETMERAFEPFFTTKEAGKGSGLGLSQVLGLAQQSGGGVALRNAEGGGTVVEVYFPRSSRPPRADDRQIAEPTRPIAPGALVLIVDDDDKVRSVTAGMAAELGCRVVEAESGAEAIGRIEQHRDIVAALIDLAMPGMNGSELARAIRRERPDIPIVYVTGYADPAYLDNNDDTTLLRKPCSTAGLQRILQAILASTPG